MTPREGREDKSTSPIRNPSTSRTTLLFVSLWCVYVCSVCLYVVVCTYVCACKCIDCVVFLCSVWFGCGCVHMCVFVWYLCDICVVCMFHPKLSHLCYSEQHLNIYVQALLPGEMEGWLYFKTPQHLAYLPTQGKYYADCSGHHKDALSF